LAASDHFLLGSVLLKRGQHLTIERTMVARRSS
jgi:hypothetical protein